MAQLPAGVMGLYRHAEPEVGEPLKQFRVQA